MDNIPPEMLEQIFVRLPVKTLVLLACVCKQWKSLIEDPSFIEKHLQVQRRDLMLVRTRPKGFLKKEAYSIYCDDDDFTLYENEKVDFSLSYPNPGGYFRINGNLNGVLCMTSDNGFIDDIYLCNPAIRKFVELPFPKVTYKTNGVFAQELGFGCDAKTNDYKVVRLVERNLYGHSEDISSLQVELFSLSTGICRNISHSASNIKCKLIRKGCQAYVNGAAHWIADSLSLNNGNSMIISFHFGQEEFRCFETPKCFHPLAVRPVVVQESLCLVESDWQRDMIWMMKDYGNSNSWTKWLDIDCINKVQRFIGSRKKGQLLIQKGGKLYSFYDENSGAEEPNNLKDLGIRSRKEYHGLPPSLYCESYRVSLSLIGKSAVTQVANQGQ